MYTHARAHSQTAHTTHKVSQLSEDPETKLRSSEEELAVSLYLHSSMVKSSQSFHPKHIKDTHRFRHTPTHTHRLTYKHRHTRLEKVPTLATTQQY